LTSAPLRREKPAASRTAPEHHQRGLLLAARGERRAACEHFGAALAQDPARAETWFELGKLLADRQQPKAAIAAYRRALALAPRSWAAWTNLARQLAEIGRLDEAERALAHALAHAPGGPEVWFNKGLVAERGGRFEEARACYRRAVRLAPEYALAIAGLIDLTRGELAGEVDERAQALLADPGSDQESKTLVHYALGRYLDRTGEPERAFGHARAANESRKARFGRFDAGKHEEILGRIRRVFDGDFFAAREGWGRPQASPVFIVGMPRSGTTLVEQILSSHPEVAAAGELDHYALAAQDLPRLLDKDEPYPECVASLSMDDVDLLGRAYLKGVVEAAGPARLLTNKLPLNFMRLGLIALLFPRARIIHCTRDPLETCLSIYLQNFAVQQTWATDLEDLGRYYRGYRALMAHWSMCLPVPVFDLLHEDLVADPAGRIAALLEFLGLGWDERCLRFHDNPRPVATPSLWQVRQPIFRSQSARRRRYERHLSGLREALD